MNRSKKSDPRSWQRWEASGALMSVPEITMMSKMSRLQMIYFNEIKDYLWRLKGMSEDKQPGFVQWIGRSTTANKLLESLRLFLESKDINVPRKEVNPTDEEMRTLIEVGNKIITSKHYNLFKPCLSDLFNNLRFLLGQ